LECGCSDYRRKRELIETLMIEYETAALQYRDHRGTAAAHAAYALRQTLRILDGGASETAHELRESRTSGAAGKAQMISAGAVCALPMEGEQACPS